MIGRAAQGRPWIFREIAHYVATGRALPPPTAQEAGSAILEHLDDHYAFYGEELGVRIARKHLHWYTAELPGAGELRGEVNVAESAAGQRWAVARFFARLAGECERLPYAACDLREARSAPARLAASPAWLGEALAA
jgi:tRNA-dihydrouridine synthase B